MFGRAVNVMQSFNSESSVVKLQMNVFVFVVFRNTKRQYGQLTVDTIYD